MLDTNSGTYIWLTLIMLIKSANILYTVYSGLSAAKYFSLRKNEIAGLQDKEKERQFLEKYIFLSRALPILILLCYIPSCINTIYTIITQQFNEILFQLDSSLYSLIGFINALAYSYFYRSIFNKCCKKKSKKQNINILI
jgi:hypothetical protein